MRVAAVVIALALLAGAAGCGDDGYPDKPQQVAKAYISTNAGSKCRFLTQELIETLTEVQGAAARATCRANVARFPKPGKVILRDAEVDEHDAEVEVVSDGKEAKLRMVRAAGRWKIAGFSE
jgi:hypothetical protein